MAKINNQAVVQKLIDELKLYPGADQIPTEIADKILAVYQINSDSIEVTAPTANVVRSTQISSQGTTTIYTTPATGEFYLTNVTLSINALTAANTFNPLGEVHITIEGTVQEIAILNVFRDLADMPVNESLTLNLQNPVKVDAGTNITLQTSQTIGEGAFSATIVGYTSD